MAFVYLLPDEIAGQPDVVAMLQALYSRSSMGIVDRLETLGSNMSSIRRSLSTWYVGYGHASIGDCGDVVVFIEGVSLLAAKAIQDYPLYNGQERSTRYGDFSKGNMFVEVPEHLKIQEQWINLYNKYFPLMEQHFLNTANPFEVVTGYSNADEAKIAAFKRTCKAMAFDVVRGLLPCGTSTSLSWKGSLRKIQERCETLLSHPLLEVRELAAKIHEAVRERYPAAFRALRTPKLKPTSVSPRSFVPSSEFHRMVLVKTTYLDTSIRLTEYSDELGENTFIKFAGYLDYGSYRDLQRHRNGVVKIEGIDVHSSLHPFYLDELNKVGHIGHDLDQVHSLISDSETSPYIAPMATLVLVSCLWNLAQFKYVCELRSKTSVHPTLRQFIFNVHAALVQQEPNFKGMFDLDFRPDYSQSNRGNQTIVKRNADGSTTAID